MTSTEPKLVDVIQEVRSLAEQVRIMEDPGTNVPATLIIGRGSATGEMKVRLAEKSKMLKELAVKAAGAIIVTGPGTQKFVEIAEDEDFRALILDASELYTTIARDWLDGVRVDKQFELDCINLFIAGVNKVLFPLGIASIYAPSFGKYLGRRVLDLNDATVLTREILTEAVSHTLNVMWLHSRLGDKLIEGEEEWGMNHVPVVLVNATPDEEAFFMPNLFSGHNVSFKAPENLEKNDVTLAFKHWKKLIAPTKSKQLTIL